ncbi:MAG: glycosyltransferase [Cyanobacteria bacterium]|nr:glycosyltransferase [Cyanobacteria bacterium CG_2015-16_32_12]NCO79044.1 glycosyltransferase [Cyanobacteria bacterium CG_2015-22_32_23]NCQ04291.1 glycosyltransferase [Cyanobacteria bacterium CG_2015-09_32_10]NCQ41579.1 glycosyltransferase [Cyanobacteria bacterium CG_2015-04_32_10]NCS85681.1 glycosyltransferase [Cyanobacteria bacterium CG_2015-02_32_10]
MSIIITLSLIIWIYLILFRGNFWLCNQYLENLSLENQPQVTVIIPARNEAESISICVESLFNQNYQGIFNIILVDDQSQDKTAEIAEKIAVKKGKENQLIIIKGENLPAGWSGKLWAMSQGVAWAKKHLKNDYFLFTDGDIKHSANNLNQLLAKAEKNNLDLVSLMVKLRCESFWEKLLIPAFIFFFQKLYPFSLVNNPHEKIAAAAGGCILIRESALTRIGGIESLKEALIDDCTLASLVKKTLPINHGIWLGLSDTTTSLRSYNSLTPIWDMVARTAFTQLNYSLWLLIGTILGMFITYFVPFFTLFFGLFTGNLLIILLSIITLFLMTLSYFPTVKFYQLPFFYSFILPIIALLYSFMTIDSAVRYWQGKGGKWKGRVYQLGVKN